MTAASVSRLAHAKINLFLRVQALREDGYHELESLIAPISLADEVVARTAEDISLTVHPAPGREATPAGPDNLVVVAALALAEIVQPSSGAEIDLHKHIPVAAGLGGGSSDAAAVLRVLDELWSCGLPEEALLELGAAVGSDVPALMREGASLVRGRGELLEPAEVASTHWVIVPFDFEVRTPDAFGWWDESPTPAHGDADAVVRAAREGDLETLAHAMFNDLQEPVTERHPQIAEAEQRLLADGALGVVMCGSGPTVAGLARDASHATAVAERFDGAIVASSPPSS